MDIDLGLETIKAQCKITGCEVRISPYPNPGDPRHPLKLLQFKSLTDSTLIVVEPGGKSYKIPAKGELSIVVRDTYPDVGLA